MTKQGPELILSDVTLRDGNHAVAQKLNYQNSRGFLNLIDQAGINWVEVGHGNGLGASSANFGHSAVADEEMLKLCRAELTNAKLSVHVMPGIATFTQNVIPAIDLGVDVFRVGSHCTEADTTQKMIERIRSAGLATYGILMMVHRLEPLDLQKEAKKMFDAGALGVVLMDSAGTLNGSSVTDRIDALVQLNSGEVGFHAHNNLGLAVSNSLFAIDAGASIIDATALGFGAGAGNAAMEQLAAHLIQTNNAIDFEFTKYALAIEEGEAALGIHAPRISTLSILTGSFGIFSGFARQIESAAELFKVDKFDICKQLANFETVAGQEDLVFEIARNLSMVEMLEKSHRETGAV